MDPVACPHYQDDMSGSSCSVRNNIRNLGFASLYKHSRLVLAGNVHRKIHYLTRKLRAKKLISRESQSDE